VIFAQLGKAQVNLALHSPFAKIRPLRVKLSPFDSAKAPLRVKIIKLSNESNKLIPEATNRQPFSLIVVAPAYIANAVKQVAVPGIACLELSRTPPETEVANVVE
jgi:hypothetical protein